MITPVSDFTRIPRILLTTEDQIVRFIAISVIFIGFMFAMFYVSYRAGDKK
jgi:hypothetical protein